MSEPSESAHCKRRVTTHTVQKVRSYEQYSLNVFGLFTSISIGLFLMLFATFLDSIALVLARLLSFIKRDKKPSLHYSRLEWDSNSFPKLQRLAHEALGLGTWSQHHWCP